MKKIVPLVLLLSVGSVQALPGLGEVVDKLEANPAVVSGAFLGGAGVSKLHHKHDATKATAEGAESVAMALLAHNALNMAKPGMLEGNSWSMRGARFGLSAAVGAVTAYFNLDPLQMAVRLGMGK
jgi:hypothetical protein